MKTAITLCRVEEAAAGPFVFHQSLADGFARAAAHQFDAVELFLPNAETVDVAEILELESVHGLAIAAVGTGAGMVRHGLSLTDPDASRREAAMEFVLEMVRLGGQLKAPAILGSMQGKWAGDVGREQALAWLADALRVAGDVASEYGVNFIYEPLNRYETNLWNQLGCAGAWLREQNLGQVRLLADLFHMNIEEVSIAEAILQCGDQIGHVHYADSNRRAMGYGHTDPKPVLKALREIGYTGYLSAEVFPFPDAERTAAQTIRSLQSHQL